VAARERIEGALAAYPGPLLVASHDRYFLGAIGVTGVLLLEAGGLCRLPNLAAYEEEALAR
jgi:ATPase subunit of ABC transporter with duplicated ATPase domains